MGCRKYFPAAFVLTSDKSYARQPYAPSGPTRGAATGLLGSGTQTTAWMYMFWHAGFPIVVIAYAFLRHDTPAVVNRRHITAGIAAAVGIAAALTLFATIGHDSLPVLLGDHRYTGIRSSPPPCGCSPWPAWPRSGFAPGARCSTCG